MDFINAHRHTTATRYERLEKRTERLMQQPIICFEGPSGVGKTTMAKLLSETYHIVPEVNLLFERSEADTEYWYLEKQMERYDLCKRSESPSILDGDVFQPIWYNWACHYPAAFLPKKESHAFYKSNLLAGRIRFPDLYLIFQTTIKELWIRKEKDSTRRRRNFEKHLKIIEPLRAYYQFLQEETEVQIQIIDYTDIESTKKEVCSAIENLQKRDIDNLAIFEQIEAWLVEQS